MRRTSSYRLSVVRIESRVHQRVTNHPVALEALPKFANEFRSTAAVVRGQRDGLSGYDCRATASMVTNAPRRPLESPGDTIERGNCRRDRRHAGATARAAVADHIRIAQSLTEATDGRKRSICARSRLCPVGASSCEMRGLSRRAVSEVQAPAEPEVHDPHHSAPAEFPLRRKLTHSRSG